MHPMHKNEEGVDVQVLLDCPNIKDMQVMIKYKGDNDFLQILYKGGTTIQLFLSTISALFLTWSAHNVIF